MAYNYAIKSIKNSPNNPEYLMLFIKIANRLDKKSKIKKAFENSWKKIQDINILREYIVSIDGKNKKSKEAKQIKALERLNSINKSEIINIVRNEILVDEIT